ncbi:MAG: TIGR04141 family sporadically distributed protein [Flavobacteriaceae bacterium]|nr:TIGR04141 family sporadically distributed protein [Flavobacteriaceae bacterium]
MSENGYSNFHFIKNNKNDRIQIFIGKPFQIKRSINFNELDKVIEKIDNILKLTPSDYLSSYEEITDDKIIKDELYPELINRIYNDTENLHKRDKYSNTTFEHDFCNPNNIQKFYEADYYVLKEKTKKSYKIFKKVTDRNLIYDAVLQRGVELFGQNDKFQLMVFLQGVRITAHQNKEKTIGSSFLFHISTEIIVENKPYFLIDTKWYHLRDTFIKDLEKNTKHILKTYNTSDKILPLKWDKKKLRKEKDYNLQYNKLNNYIVIDTIITDGLELCDVLHYDKNNLYLIHIKYGFKSEIRELTNQITISARRLKETLGTKDKLFLTKIYNNLVDKGYDVDNLSLEDFKKLFEKKIIYIMAFTSHLSKDLKVVDNIEKFTSNIARYSLIQCSGEMRAYYYDMQTFQIMRE